MPTKKTPLTDEEWHVYFGTWEDYKADIVASKGPAAGPPRLDRLGDAILCASLDEAKEALNDVLTQDNEEVGVIVNVRFTPVLEGKAMPRSVNIQKL